MGLKGNKMALKNLNEDKDVQEFHFENKIWLLLGLIFFVPINIMIFYLTEKSVNISIDLVQLPGI